MDRSRRWWWIAHGAALLVAAIGGLVCVAWIAGVPGATRVVAGSPVIPVVTGLSLIGVALAVVALLRRRGAAALPAAALALLLSGLSLFEHLAGMDLGIEGALEGGTSSALRARMAPNTAVALLLAALACLLAIRRDRVWALGIASLLGSLVAAFGGVALLGYGFDLRAAFEWAGLARMALPTAVALVVQGMAVVVTARLLARGTAAGGTLWLAGSVGAGAAVLGVLAVLAVQDSAGGLPAGLFTLLMGAALLGATLLAGTVAQARHMRLLSLALRDSEERLRRLLDASRRQALAYERLALTDALTGLASRRQFGMVAERELARSRRTGEPLSLLVLDVDHFKQVNDRLGHSAGDRVLRQLAGCVRQQLRQMDLAARWGGEELLVLLPGDGLGAAVEAAERLRRCVADLAVRLADGATLRVTVSVGVATLSPGDTSIDALVERADQALYAAKRSGRDRVCVRDVTDAAAPQPVPPPVAGQ